MTNQLESRHEFLSRGLGLAGNLGGLVCLNLVIWKKQKQKPNMEIETYSWDWNKQPLPRCTLIASVKMVGTGNRKQETSLYFLFKPQFSSVQFSHSVVSDSLWPHESQNARPPCPSPTPGVHSDSWPSSPWCHPDISSSVVPFSSCPQSLPASEFFPMSQLFA